jgi:carbon-monoxide dehydrogenase small subunit
MKSLTLELNGAKVTYEVEPRETLADFLRERCRLTATHLGCEHGACGACTVAVDGQATRSCLRLAIMCHGRSVQTLEGLGDDPTMEVLRRHFHQSHGVQCGFCTPGMLMMARDILLRMPHPDAETVRNQLSGQICRCTGYSGIVTAIVAAGRELGRAGQAKGVREPGIQVTAIAAVPAEVHD